MLFLLQLLRKPTFTKAVSLSLITACSFLGGSPEIFFICHVMLGIVVFYKLIDMAQHREWKDIGYFVLFVAAAAILVIGLTSVALFPAAEFSRLSLKSNGITDPFSLKRVFFREQGLIPFIFPYLHTVFGAPYPPIFTLFFKIEPYVGSFAVLLAITALSSKRYRSFTPAASSLFVFSILMSMGTDTAFFPTMFKSFPFFRIFQWPQNYILIAYVTLAICAAMGLDVLWNGARRNRRRFCWLGITYLFAGHLTLRHPVSLAFLIAGGGAFAVCLYLLRRPASQPSPLLRKATGTVLVGLAILELFIFSFSYRVYMPEKILSMHHFKPAIDYVRSNSTYERSAFSAIAMEVYFKNQQEYFTSYIPLAENIPFATRNCGNMNHYHRRLDKAVLSNLQWERRNAYLHNYDWSFDYPVNSSMIFGYSDISGYDSFRLRRIDEFYRTVPIRKTLDIFNVKWLVSPKEISHDHLTVSFAGSGPYVYKNKTAAPRVLLPTEVTGSLSDKEILDRMSSDTFDPRKTVLFDLSVTDSSIDRPTGEAEIVSYHPEKVEIRLSMEESGYLVLNDIYYPGWKAYLNGNEIPIMRGNYLFRAVAIPGGGDYSLVFRFEPEIFRKSAAVSIVSWIFCLAVISAGAIRKRREKQS